MSHIAAHPTVYKDRTYRSRLEARWAAFFDQLGWRYEYEPYDLNGWVPDFALISKTKSILVEVKPITHFDEDVGKKITNALPPGQEALLVGCCQPTVAYSSPGIPCVGWLGPEWGEWALAPFVWYKANPKFADFIHSTGWFQGRLTDERDGDDWGNAPRRDEEIWAAWQRAGSLTQWKPASPFQQGSES